MKIKKKAIKLHIEDNVATSINNLQCEDIVEISDATNNISTVIVKDNIPFGHKFSLKNILKNESIIKYGEIIGKATQNIKIGQHVHIHNVEGNRGRGDLWIKRRLD